jgi:hypothetical protein
MDVRLTALLKFHLPDAAAIAETPQPPHIERLQMPL